LLALKMPVAALGIKRYFKDILPLFDLHKEQFQIASIAPFAAEELNVLVEQMLEFLKTIDSESDLFSYLENKESTINKVKWIN